jgi:hypothetical protein
MAYGVPFGEINWGRPCQWGGPQGACSSAEPAPTPEIAFPVEWSSPNTGTDDGGNTVFPLTTVDNDLDMSALPNNAAAIIRMAITWFQLTGSGAVNVFSDVTMLAFRDDNGDLHADLTWIHASIVQAGGALFDITAITTPDNNTIRWQMSNLQNESAIVFFRTILTIVTAGNPVPPP